MVECLSAEFAQTDAAVACLWLKWRKGTVLPLAFTAIDQAHYATSEDGALLTSDTDPKGVCEAACVDSPDQAGCLTTCLQQAGFSWAGSPGDIEGADAAAAEMDKALTLSALRSS